MRITRHSQKFPGGKPSPACLHIQQQMPLLLDGELSEAQAQSVLRHLSDCPLCQRECEQWQQSERALAGARQYVPAPGDLRAGFYARLAAAPTKRRLFPRIDWRVAVPALTACSLAIGWLTTRGPVVSTTTGTASSALHQQIAQANALPLTKPAVSQTPTNSSLNVAARNLKTSGRAIVRASSSSTKVASRKMNGGLQRKKQARLNSSGWQIASLDARRSQPEHSSRPEPDRHAPVASLAFGYKSAKPADGLEMRLAGEPQARLTKSGRQDATLFADAQTVVHESLASAQVLSKKKATPSTDNNATAETSNGVANADRYGYAARGLKLQEFGELKEQAAPPTPTSDALANTDSFQTFALGLNAGVKQDTNVLYRGMGWQLAASGNEGVELQVRDTKRGFTNGTRLVGEVQEQNGRRVLIIQAEDAEPSADSASE